MQEQSGWLQSIAQNLAANAIWYAMGLTYGIVMAVLKKKQSSWFIPGLYGLISGVLVMIVAIAGTVSLRWPRGGPLVLAGIVLITVVAHWLIAQLERKSTVTTEPPNHQECEKEINNLGGQIYRLEKENSTREVQYNARQHDLDTRKEELWREQQQTESLRANINSLKATLNTFSVPSGQLQLIDALYFVPGHESTGLDVLTILQSDMDNRGDGKLWLGADELYQQHFRPDPEPRTPKVLRITYLHRGKQFSVTVPEDTRLVLPLPYNIIERNEHGALVLRY